MRRTVLVPTVAASVSWAPRTLVVLSLSVTLVLALTLASPVAAQEESDDQAAARASDPLRDAAAVIIEDGPGDDRLVDSIEIDAAGCKVEEKGATVTVADEGGDQATFTNAPDTAVTSAEEVEATLEPAGDQVVVEVIGNTNLSSRFGTENGSEEGTVSSFEGITCRDGAGATAAEGGGNAPKADLKDLTCTELLVLFRGGGQGQYGNVVDLDNSEVRAQIEVCLKKEIVNKPVGPLPKTGGLSLIALSVLGVVSAAAGLSVVRGGRR